MTEKPADKTEQQLGVRIEMDLAVDVKVLAVRQHRRFKDLVEEALRDLLKKYKDKTKSK